ncbi:Dolichyl-phosphate-mannose-protein mannosyltransferase [Streptomyces sp. cf386]|uniref:dolichyl-phosphate-mannose--protein mannosyltransferase n=1 Tax=Streptomyces sp. cf386 TaxID=1761904 RepID=UPI00087F3694|nr:phospholipid carrier-dependent glycosyltransferase [Streptomyces sp. cf386]SDO04401.1 Dolichyl-phosphate-mannose-protein mannosyltransferase [Streptomyces sp. cf386]
MTPTPWMLRLRRFGYAGQPRTDTRDRLVPPFPEPGGDRLWRCLGLSPAAGQLLGRWSGWGGPLLVALFAGLIRFRHLGSPRAVVFDETYYAKDAWSLLKLGYEGVWPPPEVANPQLLAHPQAVPLSENPAYVVHPPLGKWVIGLGEWAFGLDPFGWRFMVALLGTLSVLMLCRIGRRLFRSTALGCLAGVLLAVDGLHFVMSRTALLDLVVSFFVVAAFGCLLLDRDRARARLAAALPVGGDGKAVPDRAAGDRTGMGLRPWRIAAGVCLGLACATKWSGVYFLAAFGLMSVLWDIGARRVAGAERPYLSTLRKDAGFAFLSLIPVAITTYLLSWTGWFASRDGYGRQWAADRQGRSPDHLALLGLRFDLPQFDLTWVPAALRSLWHYESQVYAFHVSLTKPHGYQSNPWSWLVLGRPVLYHRETPEYGQDGCTAPAGCVREVLAIGTPLLWWAACFALLYLLYRWGLRRDWRAGAVLCAVAAGYLPWFLYQERTIFLFYAVAFVPFLCLAVAMMIGAILGPPGSDGQRRMRGAVGAGVLVLLIVWNFIYFFPLYTAGTLPVDAWRARMWLDTWG